MNQIVVFPAGAGMNRRDSHSQLFRNLEPDGGSDWGGRAQTGPHKIDARFPRGRIAARLRELSKLAPHTAYVRCQDFRTTMQGPLAGTRFEDASTGFWYVNPPFWNKAERLYRHFFKDEDHSQLAFALAALSGTWVLSYDADPGVEALNEGSHGIHNVHMRYTARSGATRRSRGRSSSPPQPWPEA